MEKKENAKHYRNMSIIHQMDTLAFEAESIAYTVCQHFGIDIPLGILPGGQQGVI